MTSPMTEAALQKQILTALNLSPKIGKAMRINAGGYSRRARGARKGTVDTFGWFAKGFIPPTEIGHATGVYQIHRGQIFWIEIKILSNKPTDEQETFLEESKETGAIAFVAHNLEDIQWMI